MVAQLLRFNEKLKKQVSYSYQILLYLELTEMFLCGLPVKFAFEFPRQSGKTEAVGDWLAYMFRAGYKMSGKKFKCLIFAPRRDQARQDYIRFRELSKLWDSVVGSSLYIEDTKTKLHSIDDNFVSVLPLTQDVNIESASGNFLIYEEAQHLDDEAMENKAEPMGANFGAASAFIGTAGTQICRFYSLITQQKAVVFTADDIIRERHATFEETQDPIHLKYEAAVESAKQTQNPVAFNRQFMNVWSIGSGQFMALEDFEAASSLISFIPFSAKTYKILSLDQARNIDGAVLTKTIYWPEGDVVELQESIFLTNGSSSAQRDDILEYLGENPDYDLFIFDTTGGRQTLPDLMAADAQLSIAKIRYFEFGEKSKNEAFGHLDERLKNKNYKFINPDRQVRFQFTNLVKEYNKIGLMKVHAPESSSGTTKAGYHDDIPCSAAMAVWYIDEEIQNRSFGTSGFDIG